jgi:putative intracellular protease/amidase
MKMNPGKKIPTILMPLPDYDFDPTEAAIPWQECATRGWRVAISTEYGNTPQADLQKLKGPLPGLVSASQKARTAYKEMAHDKEFLNPIPYAEINPDQFEGLLLSGGDTPRMRQYLENQPLRQKVLQFYQGGKLIGAICHGVLVLARTIDPNTGHSVLYGHKVTAPPKWLDRLAYRLDLWLIGRGYLIYSRCIEEEVRNCLKRPEDFSSGRSVLSPYVVSDGNLITSRWYYDAELFADRFTAAVMEHISTENNVV